MSTQRSRILETPARGVVNSVRWGQRHRNALSVGSLLVILVVGVAYLMLGTLGRNPFRESIGVEVLLAETGGLLPDQDVTLRGVKVGHVQSVDIDGDGVRVKVALDGDARIPVTGIARVSSLSPVGEQFLDFRPTTDDGPFLTDGAVIEEDNTSIPVPMATMLSNLEPMLSQVSPEQLGAVVDELGTGPEGVEKLRDIVGGGTFLVSTLSSVLPQTVGLINTSKVVVATMSDTAPGLRSTAASLAETLRGAGSMDGGLRQMLTQTPQTLAGVDALFTDNSPVMVQLLGNLATVSQMAYLREPALREFFFPQQRNGSTLEAIGSVFRDGGIWGSVDVFPRVPCDYPLPRSAPSRPDFPEPFINTHCTDPHKLVRGAAAAPRPEGDNTHLPREGSDPLARTNPAPTGDKTIPTPFAGPPMDFN